MQIGSHSIGPDHPVFVIAEASGNHGQDYATAEALVHAAADAGADAVKFQTFTAAEICADVLFPFGHDAAHDAWARGLGVERLRDLFALGGLPRAWHAPLKALAESLGLVFLSTPFSIDAARFLVEDVGVLALKIASGDLTFTPLLEYAASTRLPVLLSTGGATLDEVRVACNVLTSDWPHWGDLVLMHCVSIYPCLIIEANLRAISTLYEECQWTMGFSDHTRSTDLIPAMAIALGCAVLEKHFCLAEDSTSVDVAHSLTPAQLTAYVHTARRASMILGHGRKEPHALEMHDRKWSRRNPIDWLRPTQEARDGDWD